MDCPSCFKAPATIHPMGKLPCSACQERHNRLPSPSLPVEIIPERIKAERKERQDSIEQPHYKGELNKRYVDLWGEEIALAKGFTKKEIKNARYVMDGISDGSIRYYKDGEDFNKYK